MLPRVAVPQAVTVERNRSGASALPFDAFSPAFRRLNGESLEAGRQG